MHLSLTAKKKPTCQCIAELRCKAEFFKKTGLVFTLDADKRNMIKSDTVVSASVQQALRDAFDQLREDQASDPDWHPGTNEMVQDLVHPSMYCFVYGELDGRLSPVCSAIFCR